MSQVSSTSFTLTARWIFPVDQPPLPGGVVTIDPVRRCIEAVEPHGSRRPDFDFGNAAILPGFVNAHTHLDLTDLRGQIPPTCDFPGWLRAVIEHRRKQDPAQVQDAIRKGLAESIRYGTTLLADISAGGQSWDILAKAPIHCTVFYELIGLTPERARQAWQAALHWLKQHPSTLAMSCYPGLSPHAPYSVHRGLYATIARCVRTHNDVLVMTHLAESQAEMRLLSRRQGPFVRFLSELGVWYPKGLARSAVSIVEKFRGSSTNLLLAHGTYLPPRLRSRFRLHPTVVYCPRTHAAFGHKPHPFRRFLAAHTRVALGTDSLASNPDLDVLAEARCLHRNHADVPGDVLLRMATLSGAEALGRSHGGSLTRYKSADLVVVPLPDREEEDPHRLVLASDLPVRDVMCMGRWIAGPQAPGAHP